jgi:cardiolipin synthase
MTSDPMTIASAILVLLLNIVVLRLVPERRRSGSAMAWLRLILLVPVFELLLFLLTGDTHVLRTRREEQRMVGELIRSSPGAIPALPPSLDRLGCVDSALVLNRHLTWPLGR